MREIVLDTETTGLDPYQGHRLVEIGCIELLNRVPDRPGRSTNTSIPNATCRPRPSAVHGLSIEFLKDKPLLPRDLPRSCSTSSAMRRWSRTTPISISASSMPSSSAAKRPLVGRERLVDTLMLARRKHPGGSERARRSVPALRHRQFAAHQARRAARRRTAGRSLYRADRRRGRRRSILVEAGRATAASAARRSSCSSARSRCRRGSPMRSSRRTRPSSRRSARRRSGGNTTRAAKA